MLFLKQFILTLMLTLSTLSIVGCSGGEADYSLQNVKDILFGTDVSDLIQGDITFLTANNLVVDANTSLVTNVLSDTTENITYSIVGGADKDLFDINAQTGELTFIDKPQFDSSANNIYEVVVGVTTEDGALSSLPIYVRVVEDITGIAPLIDYVATQVDATSDIGIITQIKARPAQEGTTLSYALVGSDSDALMIDTNGNISFATPLPDYGTTPNKHYSVSVVITDKNGNTTTTDPITITLVGDLKDIRPVILSQTFNVPENSVGNMQIEVQTLGSGTVSEYILSGSDASMFTVDGSGKLQFKVGQDYEVAPNSFNIEVVAKDSNGNLSNTQAIIIKITDIDETYTFDHITDVSVLEGRVDVVSVKATSNVLTNVTPLYSLIQATEIFSIDAAGTIRFINPALKGEVYTLQVVVESLVNGSLVNGSRTVYEPAFTVSVAVDASLIKPVIDASYNRSIAIKAPITTSAILTTVTGDIGEDSDATGVSYSVTGSDAAAFSVDATGNLRFNSVLDYYLPTDSDGNNIYEVQVVVTDSNGNRVTSQLITVEVQEDPALIKPILVAQAEPFALDENQQTNVSMIIKAVNNPEAAGVPSQYLIVGGTDASLFTLDEATGQLSFKVAPDAESQAHSNSYSVDVKVVDDLGNNSAVKTYVVNVADINEKLSFTSLQNFSHVEETTTVGTIVAVPILSMPATINYTIATNSAQFNITSDGVLSFNQAPIYDASTPSNNVYTLSVEAHSQYNGSSTISPTITVTVLSKSYAISFDSDQSTADLNQNTVTSFPMTATSDAGETLTYSLEAGYDTSIFSINATSGLLTINVPTFIFSDQTDDNTYRATVVATDTLGNTARRQGVLNVNPVDGIPKFTSGTTRLISENTKALSSVSAFSPIGSSLSYTIEGGADSQLFTLTTAGSLAFSNTPNYENPLDQNRDNVYEVIIRATDTLHSVNYALQTILVTVNNVSDAPSNIVFSSTGTTSVSVSDGTHVFFIPKNIVSYETITATASPTQGALNFSIVNNPDTSIFSISNNGTLKVDSPPFSSNQLYTMTINVEETNGEVSQQTVYVTILD